MRSATEIDEVDRTYRNALEEYNRKLAEVLGDISQRIHKKFSIAHDSFLAADSDEISVDLSEEYPGAAGVQGLSFYLKESRSFADSSLPNDLQLRIRKSDEVKGSNENYSCQLEAVRNLIEGTLARTDEQVQEADAVYERALAEYNNS